MIRLTVISRAIREYFCNNNNSATTLPQKRSNSIRDLIFQNMLPLNVEHLQTLSLVWHQLISKICHSVSLPNIKLDHPTASKSN